VDNGLAKYNNVFASQCIHDLALLADMNDDQKTELFNVLGSVPLGNGINLYSFLSYHYSIPSSATHLHRMLYVIHHML
jgi:hypothetical protein